MSAPGKSLGEGAGRMVQGELFQCPKFTTTFPTAGTRAALALDDLKRRPITQLDWLRPGRGWRLAAAVKEFDYLGWTVRAERVKVAQCARPIALYSRNRSQEAGHEPKPT